jgi:Fe-S-cluster containining protein
MTARTMRDPALLTFYRHTEDLTRGLRRQRPDWPCRRGCSECCYEISFPVGITEAAALREAIHRLPLKVQVRIQRAAIRAVRAHYGKHGHPPVLRPRMGEEHLLGSLELLARSAVRFPCPLLDVASGTCRVYEDRPGICREFGTVWIPDLFGDGRPTYRCDIIHRYLNEHHVRPEHLPSKPLEMDIVGMLVTVEEHRPIMGWLTDPKFFRPQPPSEEEVEP